MIACPRCGQPNEPAARYCSNCGLALSPAAAPVETRKTVTILFCDVAGSTALGEQTDPESLRRVMARYFNEIRTVIERHGGTVEKFIGDAVMAVFGVPAVHEDDALRAVRAAAEIRARLAELAADVQGQRGFAVEWRTGINTGQVVAGDAGAGQTFVTGDAVNVAARLEQAAKPGEILIGELTHTLVREAIDAEPVQPLALKGKSGSVAGYRLLAVRTGSDAQGRRLNAPMVGRHRQRRLLDDAYEQVVEERMCHLFTVLGAAGVGKSRLVREFLATTADRALVLRGRCLSYGEGITYGPIAEIIRQVAPAMEGESSSAYRERLGALVDDERDRAQVVERLLELIGMSAGSASRDEVFWAIRTLFESLARQRPLVVVLDDLHWAEPTLLDLVDHLADWMRDAPVLLLCIARRELLEARPGWAGGKTYATTVTLEPLNTAESRELVANLLGQMELEHLADQIIASAEGNPLFVEEMLGMLIDRGTLVQRDGQWVPAGSTSDVSVPPTIQALLGARVDGLAAGERAVLGRAAVEGKVFHRAAVAELSAPDVRDDVAHQLLSLTRKELVRPEPADPLDFDAGEAFRFRHLLIRDAAYTSIPKETRAELHARFAAWLERVAGERRHEYEEVLGYHYQQAHRYRSELGLVDEETHRLAATAAAHLARGGARANDRGDPVSARKLLAAAVELTPVGQPERHAYVADLAIAMMDTGELNQSIRLLDGDIANARAEKDPLGEARLEVVRIEMLGQTNEVNVEQAIERAQELLARFMEAGDQVGVVLATRVIGMNHFFAGRMRLAREVLMAQINQMGIDQAHPELLGWLFAATYWGLPMREARAWFEQLGERPTRRAEAERLRFLGGCLGMLGEFDGARALLQQSVDMERSLGRRIAGEPMVIAFLIAPMEMRAGNYAAAEALLRGAYEGFAESAYATSAIGYLAELCVDQGRWDEAERYATVTLEGTQADDVEAQSHALAMLARVHAARGELEAGVSAAQRAVALTEATEYIEQRSMANHNLGEVLLAAGRRDEALAAFRRALADREAYDFVVDAERTRRRIAEVEAEGTPGAVQVRG